ncbi:MAG: class B sortase [Firmicutes bacterium]|nr:class B sortase [Bacillota bacterium]MBQ3123669.1 class B sortase [Bacillota bacterium]MBQ9971894.1 class B sortase [Bacillota bacterium]
MKKKIRKTVLMFVCMTFVFSAAVLWHRVSEYNEATEIYDEAVALAMTPEVIVSEEAEEAAVTGSAVSEAAVYVNPYADEFANMDFEALREVNDEVIGWINIPGTKLSYPLLQSPDNDYYLDRAWNGTKNASGSIFMECRNSFTLNDVNTIIYGHRMGNSTMFGSLAKYKDLSYWEANPIVNVSNEEGSYSYLIFAAYETDVTSDTFRIKFENKKEQQDLIDHAVENSVINTGIVPGEGSKILTLSTCIGASVKSDTRWVVQAVRVEL